MTVEELIEFRKKLREGQSKMTDEERQHNREFTALINEYNKKYPEGIPFQMNYTFEELKEAVETDKPFHEWEKFKGYYGDIPDDWLL